MLDALWDGVLWSCRLETALWGPRPQSALCEYCPKFYFVPVSLCTNRFYNSCRHICFPSAYVNLYPDQLPPKYKPSQQRTPHSSPVIAIYGVLLVSGISVLPLCAPRYWRNHERQRITRPWGRGMGCNLWVHSPTEAHHCDCCALSRYINARDISSL